jgi:hypothetical protein
MFHRSQRFITRCIKAQQEFYNTLIKDEVLLMVGCPIFPPFYIDSQISIHRKFKKNSDGEKSCWAVGEEKDVGRSQIMNIL